MVNFQNLYENDIWKKTVYLAESSGRMVILQDSGKKCLSCKILRKGKEFFPVQLHFNWLKLSNLLKMFSRKVFSSTVVLSIL